MPAPPRPPPHVTVLVARRRAFFVTLCLLLAPTSLQAHAGDLGFGAWLDASSRGHAAAGGRVELGLNAVATLRANVGFGYQPVWTSADSSALGTSAVGSAELVFRFDALTYVPGLSLGGILWLGDRAHQGRAQVAVEILRYLSLHHALGVEVYASHAFGKAMGGVRLVGLVSH